MQSSQSTPLAPSSGGINIISTNLPPTTTAAAAQQQQQHHPSIHMQPTIVMSSASVAAASQSTAAATAAAVAHPPQQPTMTTTGVPTVVSVGGGSGGTGSSLNAPLAPSASSSAALAKPLRCQCVLFGTVDNSRLHDLLLALKGVSGRPGIEMMQREFVFKSPASWTQQTSQVASELRIRFEKDNVGKNMTLVYLGELQQLSAGPSSRLDPAIANKIPAFRTVVESEVATNSQLQSFLTTIGFEFDFELHRRGHIFQLNYAHSKLTITVAKVAKLVSGKIVDVVEDCMVEATASPVSDQTQSENVALMESARELMHFAESISPFVILNKVDQKALQLEK